MNTSALWAFKGKMPQADRPGGMSGPDGGIDCDGCGKGASLLLLGGPRAPRYDANRNGLVETTELHYAARRASA